jgi:hypothetical protein
MCTGGVILPNERLRSAILNSGIGVQGVADGLGVDRKTIERWIAGRLPYRRHRFALASMLSVDIQYLWAEERRLDDVNASARAELVTIYAHRSAAPQSLWLDTFTGADSNFDMLVFAGFWLSEDGRFHRLIKRKALAGCAVRIALGDPDCDAVRQRGEQEGIGDTIGSKIRNVIHNYRPLMDLETVEFRLHDTVLYNSIYRADDDMLINPHIFGAAAFAAPILHLRRLPHGELFQTYMGSFEAIWNSARRIPDKLLDAA